MMSQRQVRLSKFGGRQSVAIPPVFDRPDDSAIMRKAGGTPIIESMLRETSLQRLEKLEPIDDEFWPVPGAVDI